jgi:hypothetical protein
MAFLIAVAIVGLGMLGGSNAFAASQRTAGNNSQPIRGFAGSCNWGGYYANNECVWYEIDDAQGLPHNHCKGMQKRAVVRFVSMRKTLL